MIEKARAVGVDRSFALAERVGGLTAFTDRDQCAWAGAQVVVNDEFFAAFVGAFGEGFERHGANDQEAGVLEGGVLAAQGDAADDLTDSHGWALPVWFESERTGRQADAAVGGTQVLDRVDRLAGGFDHHEVGGERTGGSEDGIGVGDGGGSDAFDLTGGVGGQRSFGGDQDGRALGRGGDPMGGLLDGIAEVEPGVAVGQESSFEGLGQGEAGLDGEAPFERRAGEGEFASGDDADGDTEAFQVVAGQGGEDSGGVEAEFSGAGGQGFGVAEGEEGAGEVFGGWSGRGL